MIKRGNFLVETESLFLCRMITSLQNYLLTVKFIYAIVPGKICTFTIYEKSRKRRPEGV